MSIRLSEFELDVMTHFWSDRELSAPELFERMGRERGVAYSTVKTIVDRLEQKGAIERVANRGRTIVYSPTIKRERVRKPLVKTFLRRLFGNDLRPLFAQLLQDEKLSAEELEYLRKLVARSRGEQEMSALVESLLTAFALSGLAAGCLVLLPRAPPRLRFAVAAAGLAAWLVPWGSIRIVCPRNRVRRTDRGNARHRGELARCRSGRGSMRARCSATPSPRRRSSVSHCSSANASRCGAACAAGALRAGPPTELRSLLPPELAAGSRRDSCRGRTATSPQRPAGSRRRSGSATVTRASG